MNERSLREINGNLHQSLRVGNKERDPLAPMRYRVMIKEGDGYAMAEDSHEPIELLRLKIAAKHAIAWQSENVLIIDEDDKIVHGYSDYKPEVWQEPDEPISPSNAAIRDRWILNIIQFLLPFSLAQKIGDPDAQDEIKNMLTQMNIEIAVSPTGCGVLMSRVGTNFAAWACSK